MAKTMKFAVIGLGFFGLNLALRLTEEGAEIIAIDKDEQKVEYLRDKVSYVVAMDSTDERSLRKLGLKDMDAVIVAIGEDFQSSILTTAALQEIGVRRIINRVTDPVHERILHLMQIEELVVPEAEAAHQLANRLMIKGVVGSFEIAEGYSIVEVQAPASFVGKTLQELDLRRRYEINVVTIKRPVKKRRLLTLGESEEAKILGVPSPDTRVERNDILVLFGQEGKIRQMLGQEG